ncbi:MAG: ABC transporter ATP-binding protein [Anaerolineae bacterium]|nr:ABC transporter ATP-binding protein [Anaerolineae bacterium]
MPEFASPLAIHSLEMRGIVKRFPGVTALKGVDFDVRAGEIHALLGENGAGKSTLMKILYGLYQPNEGEILLDGGAVSISSPHDSISRGIGMIHQHFMLVPSLTVAENVALGMKSKRGPLLDLKQISKSLSELSERYNLKIDPKRPIWQLAVGEQQRVEIVRALYRGAALLILDEPTAVLTPQESDHLFEVLKQMAAEGHTVIFISHKLQEVLAISSRITVLRDGSRVDTIAAAGATKLSLAEMMVGRSVVLEYEIPAHSGQGAVRLRLEAVSANSERGNLGLRCANMEVRGGEILGVAGVSGNGQHELAEVIAGMRPAAAGKILINGAASTNISPEMLRKRGVAYIPEERMIDGVVAKFTVAENYVLKTHGQKAYARGGLWLRMRAVADACRQAIRSYEIKTPSTETPIKNLSGGNIQKLVLARELAENPGVLIAAQPTRGVDIGATEYIHRRLLDERARGTAILLISEDLDEVMALSDRIIVMYEGQIVGEVARSAYDVRHIGALMAGVTAESLENSA